MSTTAPEARVAVSWVSEISRWVMPRDRAPGYKLPCGDGQQTWSALLRSSKETLTRSLGVILTAMARKPETHYAKGPGGDIAYQVVGDGPIDLVIVPGWISHVELLGADPGWSKLIAEFASFARIIQYDKLGTGASNPIVEVPTLESRVDELHAVLNAADSDRPAFFGLSQGGPIRVMFAASYPP